MIHSIKLSEKAKTQLIKVKRKTGIQNWNVLCRWAFCLSLAEPSTLPREHIPSDSTVEMSWKVFGGLYAEVYMALLNQRARHDNVHLSEATILDYFRLHLHRGISYLASRQDLSDIDHLLKLIVPASRH